VVGVAGGVRGGGGGGGGGGLVPPMPKEELPTQRMSTAICFVLGMGYP